MLKAIQDWRRKRTLHQMLTDPRSKNGCRSIGQLEKGISADRATTERLLASIGATRSQEADTWTLPALKSA